MKSSFSALVCLVLAGSATLGGSGCAGPRLEFISSKTHPESPAFGREAGVVFAVDGAGNFQACSQHIREVVNNDHLPLEVVTVAWSHGYGRIIADQIGYAHARVQGRKLAEVVQQFRLDHGGVPIHLLGHSAGSAVVITALENLLPDSVDRVCLLSPSLSAGYDLRPGLKAVKYGLHVFYSRRDTAYLGAWTGILGNSDRRWGPSSGRIGFQIPPACPEDAYLYSKLHQRPWQPADRLAGNDGKHYGSYQPDFVRLHVMPLFLNALPSPPSASGARAVTAQNSNSRLP